MIRRALCVSVVLGIAGCAVIDGRQEAPFAGLDMTKEQELQQWSAWEARGRLAVKTDQGGFNARFDWRQAGPATELVVEGPFGAGRSRVLADPSRVRIEAGDQPALEFLAPFDGAEETLREKIGVGVPMDAVAYWVRGVPDPASPVTSITREGGSGAITRAGFSQNGWRIEAEEPVSVPHAPAALPRKIALVQGAVRIRLVIDQWTAMP